MRVRSHTIAALRYRAGFSLIEMAVVLMILGFVLGGLLVSLGQTTENTRRTDATSQLKRIEEALYGFAQANGRLPCPASQSSSGQESIANLATGLCSVPTTVTHGFVPAATLGLSGAVNTDGLLTDPWGNPYRYSVSNRLQATNRAFTSIAGMKDLFSASPIDNTNMLRICQQSACTDIITDLSPAVVLSMGANWGSFSSANEVANAGNVVVGGYRLTNTNDFVSAGYNETDFDDIITWLSPNILFSRMISAGRLP
tara:strand:- start:152360 stop:153127 length:768 start_codon:yes stop_codon:yes gene_type:complete